MQQSPCFNSFSPEETSKLFPSIQRFNNGFYSPRTLFFGLGLSSSGQNSFCKKNILSKMRFSSSNKKQIFNNSNKPFLSNKRHFSSETSEKNINKTNINKTNINKTNQALNTIIKNEESIIESQNDGKKTKASSKKYSTYIPPQNGDGSNINCNNYNYGYCNNYNYGYISNSSFNKSAYIGSVKKNLLPSLSKELKSNSKNKNFNQNNNNYINEKNNKRNNTSNKKNNHNNNINKYNNSDSQNKNKNSAFKNSINSSSKKTNNDSTPYDYLFKITESLDLEKMVDYIVSSTKIYNRYNDNKENYSNNHNNIITINEENENYNYYSDNKINKKSKKNISKNNTNSKIDSYSNIKNLNSQIENQKGGYSICKCKKVECLKYSCSCLKSGNKCNNLCSCMNCKNKENNIFQIED